MEKLTFKQAFDLITVAYIKGEIKPLDAYFCFCGTLNKGDSDWIWEFADGRFQYSYEEFQRMEKALFRGITGNYDYLINKERLRHYTEDELFNGMVAALDVLKQIHIEHGEVIQEDTTLQKRELKAV